MAAASRDMAFCGKLETRWATAENPRGDKGGACRGDDGRKRRPSARLVAGSSLSLAEVTGTAGMVRRIWITIDDRSPKMLRGLRLDMYWDGAATPAVSVPIGDFFGHMLGRMATFESELFSSPEGRSFNCCIPMPFKTGMRIVATNETDVDLAMLFYEVDYTLGDDFDCDSRYFHAHWRREAPTSFGRDYELLPSTRGSGRFLGVSVGVTADTTTYFKSWWGEGEVKMHIDGEGQGQGRGEGARAEAGAHPTLCGTGTEDYIGTGWGQGAYAQRYQGCPLADHDKYQYGFYRLHIPDPVFFSHDIRVTIQQIGCWSPETLAQMHDSGLQLWHGDSPVDIAGALAAGGYGLFERQDDWSSCAYFYLDRPESGLPPLTDVASRMASLM